MGGRKGKSEEMLGKMGDLWWKKCGIGGGWQVVGVIWLEMYDLRNEGKGEFEVEIWDLF